MQISEIAKWISIFSSISLGSLLGGGVVFFLIKSYIPSYLTEKGKNLATKEDIEAITDKVESIKSGYAEILEEVRSNNQLKIAAVEREKSTKKEVYMEAIESITRSLNMVSSYADLDISQEYIKSNFSKDAGKISKIQIVGSKETVKAVTTFMAAIGTAILELTLGRASLIQRKNSIQFFINLRDKSLQEIDNHNTKMKNLHIEGSLNEAIAEIANRGINIENELYAKYSSRLDELWATQNKELLEFTRTCMDEFFNISELLPEIVLSIRNELDLDISNDDYLDIFTKHIEIGKQVIGDFLLRFDIKNTSDV